MVKETSAGLMETNLWDNIKMIKNMVMEISLMQMEPNILDLMKMTKSMVKASKLLLTAILSKDFSLTMKSKTSE